MSSRVWFHRSGFFPKEEFSISLEAKTIIHSEPPVVGWLVGRSADWEGRAVCRNRKIFGLKTEKREFSEKFEILKTLKKALTVRHWKQNLKNRYPTIKRIDH